MELDHSITTADQCSVSTVSDSISTTEQCSVSTVSDKRNWNICSYSIPKQEVVYFCQIIALYVVIGIGLVNITIQNGDANLWLSLLAGSIGYLLPNPTLKKETIILHHSTSIDR